MDSGGSNSDPEEDAIYTDDEIFTVNIENFEEIVSSDSRKPIDLSVPGTSTKKKQEYSGIRPTTTMDSASPNPEEDAIYKETFSIDIEKFEENVLFDSRKLDDFGVPGTSTKEEHSGFQQTIMDFGGLNPEEDAIHKDGKTFSVNTENFEEKESSDIGKPIDLSVPDTSTKKKEEHSDLKRHHRFVVKLCNHVTNHHAILASLLNDYTESDVFVIDGDSLLLSCVLDESLKKGQSLHCFFLVERFMFNLTDKGARYVVVFFKDMEETYSRRPMLMSLRTQLKIHLQKNTNTAVYTFSNFLSSEWKSFLREQSPYFLMVSDSGMFPEQTCFLNMLMLDSLENNIDVVLTDGQEFDHLRVYGYHIRSSIHVKAFLTHVKKNFPETIILLQKYNSPKPLFKHLKTMNWEEQIQNCITVLPTHQTDVRTISCVVSCSMGLRIHAKSKPREDEDSMTLEEASNLCKMQCLCVALMITLPLSQRARIRKLNAKWNRSASSFLHRYALCVEFALTQMSDHIKNEIIDWTHVSDISDELLLKNIAYYCEKENHTELEFGKELNQLYKCLWETVVTLVPLSEDLLSCELRKISKPFLSQDSSIQAEMKEVLPVGLIPIRSNVIEDYAGDLIKELPVLSRNDPRIPSLMNTETYDELSHWHINRPLSDDYDTTKYEDRAMDKKSQRNYQKQQSAQYHYGQSLSGKPSKRITLQKDQSEEKNFAHMPAVKKKDPKKKKKDQIIEENIKKSKEAKEKKEQQQWKIMASSLEKEIMEDFFSGLKRLEDFIISLQSPSVKYQAQLRALTLCFKKWTEECLTKFKDQRDLSIVVELMKIIQAIMNGYQDLLQKDDQHRIATYLSQLGFDSLACSLRPSKFVSHEEETEKKYAVGVGSVRFQLQYMGPHLLRDERSDPDPRVQHFIPDTWQRELLDAVDNNESAVIIAPTSSGKTYASYYCMEKVLSQSNEAIVVYVAPTKALVNQVVATVLSLFNKDLPNGMALCGVFTRDYRTDALNSQVLVTVPQCFEILLLSPHRQDWVKRIKYVIFDEIHCLGGEIGAETWDHIMSMIRCPFLALSATISNPEHLTQWLQSVKKCWQHKDAAEMSDASISPKKGKREKTAKTQRRSYDVRLVQYDKRYNDLEKYICSVQDTDINFEHYHPCAFLTIDHMKNYGIPKDLTFSPRESIQLYDCMVAAWPKMPNLKALDPEENTHLKDKIIKKNDATEYEKVLKEEFVDWVQKGHDNEVLKVLESLKTKETSEVDCDKYFPQLVEKLDKINKLPALFFAFQINIVESLACTLYRHLCNKMKMKHTEEETKNIQKVKTKAEKLKKSLKETDINQSRTSSKNEELMIKKANYDSLMKKIEKFNEVPSDCTYADAKVVDKETLRQMYYRIRYSRSAKLIYFSQKGIGYHHASVEAKARKFVEMLFRMSYIRVVTSTSSLALGINMPCKSVVFLHDSPFLDSLNYRQMAGRAGRRGHDLVGNVYFFNIPMPKVKKLLKSNVPQLRGQFPLSVTFILRLMLLAAKADDKKDANAKVLSILMHPLMAFKKPQEAQMLKLYCIFSLQFLLYEGYLNEDCDPIAFTGLVTHLHYHEPSNFVFVRFLEKGLFHQLCKPSSEDSTKFPDSVMESLVLILAHIFGRRYLPPNRFPGDEVFSQSKVFLDKLPEDFASVIEEYNRKVSTVFGQCLLAGSKLADMEKEQQLPLSKIKFSGTECKDSGLVDHLMPCCEGRSGISPFACLSGNTDEDLMNMRSLSSLMMQTAYIPEKHIPLLHIDGAETSEGTRYLNAYALDFFKHGCLDAIAEDNGFNSGDAYYVLRDFSLSIASISVSLTELCESDPVALAFEQLKLMYQEKLRPV
ncbi:probable ATP-dependent RNA helicase DDX60 isoform X2 [Phyllobates terribilis]|uniref:probable ATP-dependent RNA helicase DDX60 isoform X2 n=1 Tax=Phyllobates terribilis TaxID=111132 RepID=UPI003CCAB429